MYMYIYYYYIYYEYITYKFIYFIRDLIVSNSNCYFLSRSGFKIVVRNGRNAKRRHPFFDPPLRFSPPTWHRATTLTPLTLYVHTITTTDGHPSLHPGSPPWPRPRFHRRISINQITTYFSNPINRDPP